jgi:hypothetical protein
MPRKMMEGRRKGRPRLRWMDDVVVDLRVMKVKQWTEKAKIGSNGDWLFRKTRLIQGCSADRIL